MTFYTPLDHVANLRTNDRPVQEMQLTDMLERKIQVKILVVVFSHAHRVNLVYSTTEGEARRFPQLQSNFLLTVIVVFAMMFDAMFYVEVLHLTTVTAMAIPGNMVCTDFLPIVVTVRHPLQHSL